MKDLWIEQYDELYWQAIELGMSEESAHHYAESKIDGAYGDRIGDMIDYARDHFQR